jgi:hypothetical protein
MGEELSVLYLVNGFLIERVWGRILKKIKEEYLFTIE